MATLPVEQGTQSIRTAEKAFTLFQLDELLFFGDAKEKHSLKLKDPRRRLIHQGFLGYKSKQNDCRVFLLDHALIVTELKVVGGRERLRVVHHPIPIGLLQVSLHQTRLTLFGYIPLPVCEVRYQLRFSSLGKRFNNNKTLTLFSSSVEAANTWIETIRAQRDVNQQSSEFNVLTLGQDIIRRNGEIRVNCVALYGKDQTIVYGTGDGVYVQLQNGQPRKAIDLADVQRIDVLEDLSLLVILAERSVLTFPLETLEMEEPTKHMNRITIASQTSFFKTGTYKDRTMLCTVKASSTSSTIKILESVVSLPTSSPNQRGQTSSPDKDKLRPFREFRLAKGLYSVQFLKTKLCVASTTGFDIVDLETLDTQALLDPTDQKLDFVHHIEPRPLRVYCIGGEFLVCYREFAFYANSNGKKSDKDVVIYWEGTPIACALHYPYIVAFSPNFVEIRHVDDGSCVQVIQERGVRCLYAKGSPAEDLAYHLSRRRENNILVSFSNQVAFLTPILSPTDRRHSK
ncbi:unnamed protein product [Rhizoctonia solani]|nr:unnamed protein product [Rhizoctonia solani]